MQAATQAFRAIGTHRFRVADVARSDRPEVERLFEVVFGQRPHPQWHDWKYAVNAAGAVGLWHEDGSGRLAAHYAGIPRRLLWRGTEMAAVQIGDVMVAPDVRGLLTRKGPFFNVCSTFFAGRVGEGRPFRLAFGFPNERHLRLGMALGLYHDAGPIHEVSWPAQAGDLPRGWRWAPLADGQLERALRHAWPSMARDLAGHVLGMRDADHVRHRFLERPDRRYQLFALSRWPHWRTEAVVVMRREDDRAELLDVVGRRTVLGTAIAAARAEAARSGAARLTAWASPAVVAELGSTNVEVGGQVACLAVAKASALADDERAAARWWWMGGDTDFL